MKRNAFRALIFAAGSALAIIAFWNSMNVSKPSVSAVPALLRADEPLAFIPNRGQAVPEVLFYARQAGMTLWLTEQGIVFDRAVPTPEGGERRACSRMDFLNVRPGAKVTALDPTPYLASYFYGSDEAEWRTDIPTSKSVLYRNLYDGIDLKVYGNGRRVEHDWIVRPGADPGRVRFACEGDYPASLDAEGNLVLGTSRDGVKILKPVSYQFVAGRRIEIASSFRKLDAGIFGFKVGAYDRRSDLVIDPYILVYSTYLGGRGADAAFSVAADGAGAAYIAGFTESLDFPPVKVTKPRQDVFITKLAPDGKTLVYSAFFPSEFAQIRLPKLAVDKTGAVYLAGVTPSRYFPVKKAFQKTYGGGWSDAFFLKLAPSGKNLVFSSYLGGSRDDLACGISVDAAGFIYIGGETISLDFPVQNAFQGSLKGSLDVFLAKFSPNGQDMVFSTYLGSSHYDEFGGLAVDAQGNVFIVGSAGGADLPIKNSFQKIYGGQTDAFITKLASSGKSLIYSSYLGGPGYDGAGSVAIDDAGAAYVAGWTYGGIPVKNGFQKVRRGGQDGFVTKVAPDGRSLEYSTYLGGAGDDGAMDLAVDLKGVAYVAGFTASRDFPLKNPYQNSYKGSRDNFLTILSPSGKSPVFSTYLGGSYWENFGGVALDPQGDVLVVGMTNSPDFPVLKPYQKALAGDYDAFVLKFKVTK
jgi:hypothetical protein